MYVEAKYEFYKKKNVRLKWYRKLFLSDIDKLAYGRFEEERELLDISLERERKRHSIVIEHLFRTRSSLRK